MARCPDPKMGCFDRRTLGFSVSPDGHVIIYLYNSQNTSSFCLTVKKNQQMDVQVGTWVRSDMASLRVNQHQSAMLIQHQSATEYFWGHGKALTCEEEKSEKVKVATLQCTAVRINVLIFRLVTCLLSCVNSRQPWA